MSSFPIGCNVTLQKLVKGSQYNGETGIVKTNCDANNGGRQNVLLLDGNKMVAVKPDNMILVQSKKDSYANKSKSGGKSSSSKKKRGKQRKAAKQQTAAAATSSNRQDTLDTGSYYTIIHPSKQVSFIATQDGDTYFLPEHHELAALYIQRGDATITLAMEELAKDDVEAVTCDGISRSNISLVQSGILSSVLNFLKRCEHETLDVVMASARGDVFTPSEAPLIPNIGGNMDTPSRWIRVLFRAEELEPDCMMQIVENIGPLVKCMCNDMTRLFFKSNKHWREGIESFVRLIGNTISKSMKNTDREVANTLLQHEGLLTSIVQMGFWKDHRPDIVEVLGVEECTVITEMGKSIVGMLVNGTYQWRGKLTAECKQLMWSIGTTPIVSREYDQACMTSYNEGFIHRTKEAKGDNLFHDLLILQVLVTDIDCVDKGVITALIDFGSRFVFDYDIAAVVAGLSGYCLKESDTRVAFAIRSGLVEMCLGFIDRYGKDESLIDVDEISVSGVLNNVFTRINTVSLHQKTAKAIKSKRIDIERVLARMERKSKVERALAGITNDMNDDEDDCNRLLLDMVRSILNLNESYCCWCNKSLSKTEVKQCNGCNHMTYCSRACQREDWLNGHNMACNEQYSEEKVGQFQGRLLPVINKLFVPENDREAAKLGELEINITKIQLKLFLDNAETILNEAISLGLDLCDCVVVFDLTYCPMQISVVKYTDYYSFNDMWEGFEKSRSEENITCVYYSEILIGEWCEDKFDKIPLQRLFPHEWLISKER